MHYYTIIYYILYYTLLLFYSLLPPNTLLHRLLLELGLLSLNLTQFALQLLEEIHNIIETSVGIFHNTVDQKKYSKTRNNISSTKQFEKNRN